MNRIKQLRKKKRLTLMNLSKELGLPGSTLSQYENSKRQISIGKSKKIAESVLALVICWVSIHQQKTGSLN